MFARKVSVRLKPNSFARFTTLMDRDILPWLRKQEGFLHLIILAVTDSSEVATISFWDHKGNAEAYNSIGYPAVLKVLEELLDGVPYVKTYDVLSSTLHDVLTPPVEPENLVGETDLRERACRSFGTSA